MPSRFRFRAWDKENKKMVAVDDLRWKEGHLEEIGTETFCHFPCEEDTAILMQSTELLDKNGVEIFEGDLITYNERDEPVEVIFYKGTFCYKSGDHLYHIFNEKYVMIVGNVYEHPNLLTK